MTSSEKFKCLVLGRNHPLGMLSTVAGREPTSYPNNCISATPLCVSLSPLTLTSHSHLSSLTPSPPTISIVTSPSFSSRINARLSEVGDGLISHQVKSKAAGDRALETVVEGDLDFACLLADLREFLNELWVPESPHE
jgi:hypothetical protein